MWVHSSIIVLIYKKMTDVKKKWEVNFRWEEKINQLIKKIKINEH